jgi:MOSC domain-containing protein YiiM
MAKTLLFVGNIRPLPESGRPTGMYKQAATGQLEIGFDGFTADQQADKRVHGGPEKAIHLYPAAHYAKLAQHFPDAASQLIPGSIGENISTPDLTESDVKIGDIYRLGTARLQVCQPRNPCWKIDERFASEGMAAFIAEHSLTGWYWRVLSPGHCLPGDELKLETPANQALTLAEAMQLWQSHRPELAELEQLAATPGIATQWQNKMEQRMQWLRKNPTQTATQAAR